MSPLTYSDKNRGVIQNRERARQIIDFSRLRYKNITPTDLDGLIEYQNKAFILYEYKFGAADMPHGQRIAFERLIDCLNSGSNGKPSVLFLCKHEIADCRIDIPAERIIVASRYYNGKWKNGDGRTAQEYTEAFLEWVNSLPRERHG